MTFRRDIVLLAAAVMLALSSGPAAADELYFSPADTMVWTTVPFPVHVFVDDIDSLMGWDISVSLTGDPSVKIMGVMEGTLPGSGGDPTFFRWLNPWDADSVSVNGSVLGTVVDGPGILFTIYVQALHPGMAWLDFSYSELRNGVNQSLPHGSDSRSRIVVLEAIAVEESTWGAIKAVHRGR
jgi:hypothetical protein